MSNRSNPPRRLRNGSSKSGNDMALEQGDWDLLTTQIQNRLERETEQINRAILQEKRADGRPSEGYNGKNGKKSSKQRKQKRQLVLQRKGRISNEREHTSSS